MKKKVSTKKKIIVCIMVAAAMIFFVISPLFPYALSLGVMSVYSDIHEKESLMAEKGIALQIPGGSATKEKDWYPFVMTFNAGNDFGRWAGDDRMRLTILYNFPAFDLSKGCSMLYDRQSPYYNGFYGAYLVTGTEKPFGFNDDGSLDLSKTALVPQYDFQRLVLRDFGISRAEQVFEWTVTDVEEDLFYAESAGWTRADAELLVNGTLHEKKGFVRSYLQYGAPEYDLDDDGAEGSGTEGSNTEASDAEADGIEGGSAEGGNTVGSDMGSVDEFAPVKMVGRVYGKYFAEWDCSIFFYILAAEEDVLKKCDEEILCHSTLS